jgi:glycogen synthase
MKVLMTADTVGGVWTYALDLCQALEQHGVEVALASMGAPLTEIQRRQISALPNTRLFESRYRLEWMDDPWTDLRDAGRWLLQVRDAVAPNVIHLNNYTHGSLDWHAPVVMVAHSCVLTWWEAVKGQAAAPEWDRYRQEVTQGLRSASVVVAPSHAMLNSIVRHYGPLPPTRVIYNGRDPLLYHAGMKESFVFSAGRLWDEAKNLHALEEAAGRIVWPVLVAGDGLHPNGPCAEVTHVRFIGKLSPQELAMVYARAAIYALPAKYEPFGLSALEAALSSCALVLGDIPSLREIWGSAATFVDPTDSSSLAYAVNSLVEDPDRLREMAVKAKHRAMRYSPSHMGDEYLEIYRQLLTGPPALPASVGLPGGPPEGVV